MIHNRNYRLLLISQFLGAFGDNAILAVILGQLTFRQQQGLMTDTQLSTVNAIYNSLLFVPYVLLAPLAGYLNDRYAKTRWLLSGNFIKFFGAAICSLSIFYGPVMQGIGYFVVGIGACVYSPAKYGILPEILRKEDLVKANGMVELLTLVAILTGNIGGAAIIDRLTVLQCYIIVGGLYATSMLLNLFMARTPAHTHVILNKSFNEFFINFADLLRSPRLCRILLGTGTFWVIGAVMKMNFQPWGLQVLDLKNNTQISLLGLWLSLGVMFGSVIAGQLYRVGDLHHSRLYGWIMSGFILALGLVDYVGSPGTELEFAL